MRAHPLSALLFLLAASPLFAAGDGAGLAGPAPVAEAKPKEEKGEPLKPLPALGDEQKKTVDQAIKDFASEEFEVRERASKEVLEAGPGAIPQLETALKTGGDDAEKQARVKKLVDELKAKHRGGPTPEQLRDALAAKVSFEFVDKPLQQCLDALCTQVALPKGAIKADDGVANIPLSLRVADVQLELALQWVGKLAGAAFHLEKTGIRLGK